MKNKKQSSSNSNYYGDFRNKDDFYRHYTGFDTSDAKNFWQKQKVKFN
jgi:hypothetical protein